MPRTKPRKPAIKITTVVLTPEEQRLLQLLSADVSDVIGRRVSGSSVLRACVRYLWSQGLQFSRDNLVPIIDEEMVQLRWGRKKES